MKERGCSKSLSHTSVENEVSHHKPPRQHEEEEQRTDFSKQLKERGSSESLSHMSVENGVYIIRLHSQTQNTKEKGK